MRLLVILAFTAMSIVAMAESNYKLSAAGDVYIPASFDDDQQNRAQLRGAELMVYGPIDHRFDGVINLAGHDEDGVFTTELHEAYIFTSKLIPRSRIKAGKIFLGVGRLNQIHMHDWPFITSPKVQSTLFNASVGEGAADTGIEYSYLLPMDLYLDLTLGVTNGYIFGHSHGSGARPKMPTHYVHPKFFFDFGQQRGLLVGLNYLGRTNSTSEKMTMLGLDLTYKKRAAKTLLWLIQSEAWFRKDSRSGALDTRQWGSYLYLQKGFSPQWYFGTRFDAFSVISQKFQSTLEKQDDFDYAIVPTVTYKSSEFATFRLAYAHGVETAEGEKDVFDRRLELQMTFLLGAHPAHDF